MEIKRIDNVIHGIKENIPIDERGIGRMIYNRMKKNEDKILQIHSATNEKQTYAAVNKKLIRIALEMRNRGVKPKDIIMTCSANSFDTILPVYSTLYLNAVTVTLDPSISLKDSIHLVKIVSPKLIFVTENAVDLIENVVAELEKKPEIVVMGLHENYATVSDFLKPHANEDMFIPDDVEDVKNISNIFFSSGTTGRPKAVLHSNYSMMKGCITISNLFHDFTTSLYYSSFYWISAFLMTTAVMIKAGKRLFAEVFTPESFLKHVENYQVTYSFIATSYGFRFSKENTSNSKTDTLKDLLVGGSAITEKQVRNLQNYFPQTQICIPYGQTEAGGLATLANKWCVDLDKMKLDSAGLPLPNAKLKIADLVTRKTLGPNEKGEICVIVDSLFTGYLSSPENSAENPFDGEGFLKTGDIGYYDEDNCLFFCDRIKEMFKYQSWHVVPASVECVICEHPAVLEAVVIGVPHEVDEHHPLALVILKYGHRISEEELLKFANAKLSDREKLRGGLKIVKKLPRTVTGKVSRPQVRQLVFSGDLKQLVI